MIVEAASRIIALQPVAVLLILVFAEIRFAILLVRPCVLVKLIIINGSVHLTMVLVSREKICQCFHRLRCGEGPYRAIPFTGTHPVRTELRMTSLGSGLSPARIESSGVDQLIPGFRVFVI